MLALIKKQLAQTLSILKSFRGNARGVLLTEPMWGIPFSLFTAYASVYMIALGCTNTQVGLIASIGLVFQMIFALVSGYITDRFGRKRTTLIFDLLGWTTATLIWAVAQNFYYFLIAAVANSIFRVVHTSWSCLFIEDTQPAQRVHVYTWIHVAGILAGFFAPAARLLVKRFTLIPAVRVLYLFAAASMTAMFFVRNSLVHETKIGIQKMIEAKTFRVNEIVGDYSRVGLALLKSPLTLLAFLLLVLNNIHMTVDRTFLSILLLKGLHFPEASISLFPAVKSGIMLLVYVFIMPSLGKFRAWKPLLAGMAVSFLGYLVLVLSPKASYVFVLVSTALGAAGMAVVFPFVNSLLANFIPDTDRAKTLSILHVFLFAASAPFGYIGGLLAANSEKLPFVLLMAQHVVGAALVLVIALLERKQKDRMKTERRPPQ